MIEEFKKEFTPFKFLNILLIIAVSIYLLQIFSVVIGNFSDLIFVIVLAWLLSFILEPVVNLTTRVLKLSTVWAALFVYILLGALTSLMIFIFIPLVSSQLQTLSKIVPQYFSTFPQFVKTWNDFVNNSINTFILFIPSVANILIDAVLILFLSFYFVVDKDRINAEAYRLTPRRWHQNLQLIQKVIDETFASYLQIQFIFGVIAGLTTWLVLAILGINFAPSVAFLSGLLTIIPLVGPILALVPPVFITLATNPQNPSIAIIVFIILLIIQQVIFNYIGPKLMGKAFKLHPIIVLLSIIVGFKIAGAFGAIFIVPILGILVIVFKELGHYFINSPDSSDNK
jgi:predicted PurR-regulated permease PerM